MGHSKPEEHMQSFATYPLPHSCICWCCSVYWVKELCATLCDPMDCITPGSSVLHCLLEFAQIHVHWVGDAIQPSHLLSSPSPPDFSLSQHQGLFRWVSSSHEVAKGLELQFQSFQWIFRVNFLQDRLVCTPCSPKNSQESSPTPQFKSISHSCITSPITNFPQHPTEDFVCLF